MDFTPFSTDSDKWKQHFVKMSERNVNRKDFYALHPKQKGRGEQQVVMVSPTEQDVARAKMDIKYNNENLDSQPYYTSRERASNIKTKKRKNDD